MKVAILSDTHCPDKVKILPEPLLNKLEDSSIQYLIHAGDITTKKTMNELSKYSENSIFVKGNMDKFNLPKSRLINIDGIRIFVTHGDNSSLQSLKYEALEKEADVLVLGHSHRYEARDENILILNPGSPTVPKYEKPGFIVGKVSSSNFSYRRIELW